MNVTRFDVGVIDTTRAARAGLHRDMARALDGPSVTPNNPCVKQMRAQITCVTTVRVFRLRNIVDLLV